ncbi:hypothetical protein AURDEDRAFT_175670 [Auricularia subglabra TFB-10046 SS5]|uniref:Uncharacterized protein n=1 Tax=Auricularia subglabra (strain TFB-10046 / SS5) TaxID=717982 RepID=J0WSS9_AURST|nr:hypothetical protein AURDEDRAFT_175670 [Auricularia subglabra TFB-10046 SS5]
MGPVPCLLSRSLTVFVRFAIVLVLTVIINMRFALFLLAAATGFVAAQNDTDTDAPADVDPATDFHACSVQCAGVVIEQNTAHAAKCNATAGRDAQTACLCESSKFIGDMQTCLETTCPTLMDGVDFQETCDVLTGKKPIPGTEPPNGALGTKAGVATFLTAAGALVAGALLF